MKKRWSAAMGLGVLFIVFLSFGLSWGQTPPTLLVVVRASDDSLWKMTCDEIACSPFSSFPGMFHYQPTVTWDEISQGWVIVGTASNNSMWMATFDKNGNFNNDWHSLPGQTPSPVAMAANSGYVSTVHVGPVGTATQNGSALLNALAGITAASSTNPFLLKIEPGIYDIGTSSLQMKQYVDVEGSGENTTVITGHIDNETSGVVKGGNNAEIRFLKVQNTGGGFYAIAISNMSASPKMTNVTASGSGATQFSYGVLNGFSSPTMANVTASASGNSGNIGVNNGFSSPTMTNVTASASGGAYNVGVQSTQTGTIMINNSIIIGSTNTIYNDTNSTTLVGNTKLDGGPVSNSGTLLTCVGAYNGSYVALNTSCQ